MDNADKNGRLSLRDTDEDSPYGYFHRGLELVEPLVCLILPLLGVSTCCTVLNRAV